MSDRLSIKECREALGDIGVGMTDERVAQIRDYLYALVHNIIDEELNKFYVSQLELGYRA